MEIEADRSGAATGRFDLSRKVNIRRVGPQVVSTGPLMITGRTLGLCDETFQPERSDGGVGAVAHVLAPVLEPAVGVAPDPPGPHDAVAAEARRSAKTIADGKGRERGDMHKD